MIEEKGREKTQSRNNPKRLLLKEYLREEEV